VDSQSLQQRLSRISTLWSLVDQAHRGPADTASAAQRLLLERYSGAIHRYLLGAVRNPDEADELFQEFCLRFLRGDFRRASPERGRFRSFIKTALFHLVVDYHKRRAAAPLSAEAVAEPAWTPPASDAEQAFRESWREELLDRAWMGLAEIERKSGQPLYSVLHFRTEQPLLSSTELAEQLGTRLGREFTVGALRQALYRARLKFTDLLLQEVTQSLEGASEEDLEQELLDLGLLDYCRSALERRGGPAL
jgi:RNA polymerase sigma-70 factor (ECF subfamily)